MPSSQRGRSRLTMADRSLSCNRGITIEGGTVFSVGQRLQIVREALEPRVSQRELARRLRIGSSTISKWEAGDQKIPADALIPIAKALGVHPAELLPTEENEVESYAKMANGVLDGILSRLSPRERKVIDALIDARLKEMGRERQVDDTNREQG